MRSLSSLFILKDVMAQLNAEAQKAGYKASELQPRDVFDLVAGSGSGGLIAIMLGKLGMTIDECISVFESLLLAVLEHMTWRGRLYSGLSKARSETKTLDQLLSRMIGKMGVSPSSPFQRAPTDEDDPIDW